jgi:hypothetical protein
MSNRLADQFAVLGWVNAEMRDAGRHQPLLPTRGQMSFETVTAAVDFAKTKLPEAYRANAAITAAGVTLHWGDIARWVATRRRAPPRL